MELVELGEALYVVDMRGTMTVDSWALYPKSVLINLTFCKSVSGHIYCISVISQAPSKHQHWIPLFRYLPLFSDALNDKVSRGLKLSFMQCCCLSHIPLCAQSCSLHHLAFKYCNAL